MASSASSTSRQSKIFGTVKNLFNRGTADKESKEEEE